jgi:hypothetical protein
MSKYLLLTVIILVSLTCSASATAKTIQNSTPPSRSEAEREIRKATYEIVKAILTDDLKAFKQRASKRTLDLFKAGLKVALNDERGGQILRLAGITTVDEFIPFILHNFPSFSPEDARGDIDSVARANAEGTVIFKNDKEAMIEGKNTKLRARAILEKKEWKVDMNEHLKPILLQMLPASKEMKETVKRY